MQLAFLQKYSKYIDFFTQFHFAGKIPVIFMTLQSKFRYVSLKLSNNLTNTLVVPKQNPQFCLYHQIDTTLKRQINDQSIMWNG